MDEEENIKLPIEQAIKGVRKKFKKVVLHVGPDKTGSTAIQYICATHRAKLLNQGVYYPSGGWHAELGSCFCDFPERYVYNRDIGLSDRQRLKARDSKRLRDFCAELENVSGDVLVLSYEGFVHLDVQSLGRFHDFICEYADQYEVVFYARDPYSYEISAMSQRAKTGRLSYIQGKPIIQLHKDWLEKLAIVFGAENLKVREFSRDALLGGDVVLDFLSLLELPDKVIDSLPHDETNNNRSLSREAIYLADRLITRTDGRFSERKFKECFSTYLHRVEGSKNRLTFEQAKEVELKSREHLQYLFDNFGISFPDGAQYVCDESCASQKMIDSLVSLSAELILQDVGLWEEMDFRNGICSEFITEISGLSACEACGCWTDARLSPSAALKLSEPLPEHFVLALEVGAFGPNVGKDVKVRVGKSEQRFVVTDSRRVQRFLLKFNNVESENTIEIIPPEPTAPCDLDPASKDKRKLGVRLVSLKLSSGEA